MTALPGPQAQQRRMTVEEYLEFERNSEEKHDYVDGYLFNVRAMAGTTAEHASIQVNWLAWLSRSLHGRPCRPFGSDLKIRAMKKTRYRYPDISVACQPIEFDPRESGNLTLVNPTMVIEILSDSTERTDRGQKFYEYREIESLREYVLTSQHIPLIESYFRDDSGQWVVNFSKGLDTSVRLRSLGIEIPLREIYAGVTFKPEDLESIS